MLDSHRQFFSAMIDFRHCAVQILLTSEEAINRLWRNACTTALPSGFS